MRQIAYLALRDAMAALAESRASAPVIAQPGGFLWAQLRLVRVRLIVLVALLASTSPSQEVMKGQIAYHATRVGMVLAVTL